MTVTLPQFQSSLSQPVTTNNFMPLQSSQLDVTTTSAQVTFTALPGTLRRTLKITNTGTVGCYVATGTGSATAIPSVNQTPLPASGNPIVANCDFIAAGAIITQDYQQGTDTVAAITVSSTTTLEITIGVGQ